MVPANNAGREKASRKVQVGLDVLNLVFDGDPPMPDEKMVKYCS